MFDLTAKRDGKPTILRFHRINRALCGSAQGQKSLTIGHLDDLRQNYTRCPERGVQVPYGAGATMFGDAKRGGVKAFCDIARLVHAKKEEGNAAPSIALHGG